MSELDSRHERMFAMSSPGGTAGPPRVEVVEKGEMAARAGTGVSRMSTRGSVRGRGRTTGVAWTWDWAWAWAWGSEGTGGGVEKRRRGLPGAEEEELLSRKSSAG